MSLLKDTMYFSASAHCSVYHLYPLEVLIHLYPPYTVQS